MSFLDVDACLDEVIYDVNIILDVDSQMLVRFQDADSLLLHYLGDVSSCL